MIGVGFRSEMLDWNPADVRADFYEVAPENWVRRDRAPLYRLREAGHALCLHGVHDPVVIPAMGRTAFEYLNTWGVAAQWHEYPMEHEVAIEELSDIHDWLSNQLQ